MNGLTFNAKQNDDIFRIPGPVRLPLFGTKWSSWFNNMNKLHIYYADLNRKYGDVVLEMMGNVPVVSLFNRVDIEKVLKYPSKYPFRPPTDIVLFYRSSRPDRYSSVGMANAQGAEWAHLRNNLTPKTLENRQVLANFCPDLNEICDYFIEKIKKRRNCDNIAENVEEVLQSMSFESVCHLILGKRFGFLDDINETNINLKKLGDAVKNIFKSFRETYYGKKPLSFELKFN